MKNYMIVRQKVKDIAQFQRAFDQMKDHRHAAGLTDLGQFCASDDPDTVVVVMEAADIGKAKEFWHSATLAKGRERAGIVGPVEAGKDQVWLTDGLVRDRMQHET
jgi:erythromycin esterase-like protein